MSKEALKQFKAEMTDSTGQEFAAFAQAYEDGEASLFQVLAAFVQAKGYDVSVQDVRDLAHEKAEAHELSEEDLEQVAGGLSLDEIARNVGNLAGKVGASVMDREVEDAADAPVNPILALDAAWLSLKDWI